MARLGASGGRTVKMDVPPFPFLLFPYPRFFHGNCYWHAGRVNFLIQSDVRHNGDVAHNPDVGRCHRDVARSSDAAQFKIELVKSHSHNDLPGPFGLKRRQ